MKIKVTDEQKKAFRAGWEARDQNYGNLCPPTLEEALQDWIGGGDLLGVNDAQSVDNQQKEVVTFRAIPEPLPTLRPIAEMSETVPEGCVRLTGCNTCDEGWKLDEGSPLVDTHFIDIRLPVESAEDKWRAEFETWATQTSPQRHLWDTFTEEERGWIFNAWKAAKSATQP